MSDSTSESSNAVAEKKQRPRWLHKIIAVLCFGRWIIRVIAWIVTPGGLISGLNRVEFPKYEEPT
jgi:hypothetical protein